MFIFPYGGNVLQYSENQSPSEEGEGGGGPVSCELLFSPLQVGSFTVKNRLVLPALRTGLAHKDGTVSQELIAFYRARAEGGAGLIVVEGTMPCPEGRAGSRQLAIYSDEHIPGLIRLREAIHEGGAGAFLQLAHAGGGTSAQFTGRPSIVSGLPDPPALCVEMTGGEILALAEEYADAAQRAQRAGFDGVEIAAANGGLLQQFLSPHTNTRTDEFGGDWRRRCRPLREVISAVRRRVGPDYPVTLRIAADEFLESSEVPDQGLKLSDTVGILPWFVELGLDGISVTSGTWETQNTAWEPASYEPGWRLYLAAAIKKAVDVPVTTVSVIRDPEMAEDILRKGMADLIGVARGQMADPEWGRKAREGRGDEIRKCISCLHCREQLLLTGRAECAVNAEACHELEYGPLRKDGDGRRVAVIGSGPSGMEAARVLALRGFAPVLFEQENELGGQLRLACRPPKKEKLGWLLDFYRREMSRLGVDQRTGTAATAGLLQREAPYAVIAATGSLPALPPGVEHDQLESVYLVNDVLTGAVDLTGKTVAVVGSGPMGLETAELLCEKGSKVTVIEMQDIMGPDLYFQNRDDILTRLRRHQARLLPGRRLLAVGPGLVRVMNLLEETEETIPAQAVVLSTGVHADTSIRPQLLEAFPHTLFVGDADCVGRVAGAVRSGYRKAAQLR